MPRMLRLYACAALWVCSELPAVLTRLSPAVILRTRLAAGWVIQTRRNNGRGLHMEAPFVFKVATR